MSWWDYGYQITAMANRTILVDNNTWNNTHISRVGQVSAFVEMEILFLKNEIVRKLTNNKFELNEISEVGISVSDFWIVLL